ncbi:MAG: IS110 family transposase [Blastocatellia bacterium]
MPRLDPHRAVIARPLLEASGYSPWFEQMLEQLGHQVWIGDAAQIRRSARRRQKNDRRDAELILDLLVKGEFPRLHKPSALSREVLDHLRYRTRLVKVRTMAKNNIRALSARAGLSTKANLFTRRGMDKLNALPMGGAAGLQLKHWLAIVKDLDGKIAEVDNWLKRRASADKRVTLLQTHPGIGLLTSLGLVHTLDPVTRFSSTRKVAAYAGLELREWSSGERRRMLGISKAGPRLLRYLIIEAAHTAVKYDEQLKRFYQRLMRSKGKARAMVAVGGKLLIRSFIMLRDGVDYAEFVRRGIEAGLPEIEHRLNA